LSSTSTDNDGMLSCNHRVKPAQRTCTATRCDFNATLINYKSILTWLRNAYCNTTLKINLFTVHICESVYFNQRLHIPYSHWFHFCMETYFNFHKHKPTIASTLKLSC